jgi:PHD/YefM family antitoxin component YafN of YafNO toxin-antitoxin module
MTEKTLSISEAQRELTSLPEKFEEGLDAISVTRYGKPVMAIVSHESYLKIQEMREIIDSLLETLEILQDKELMASFREGVRELNEGKGQPLDEVLKELGWE